MKIEDLKNKKVVIFGLGEEGISTARFLAENKVEFTISEKNDFRLLPLDVQDLIKASNTHVISGEDHSKNLKDFDVIFRAPGIPLWNLDLLKAQENGAEITSHTKLFFDLCSCPIIGVTGTKGKGTTATLIYEMLKASGKDVYLGGNIGRPPLDFLKKLTSDSVVVLELSSFQLEDLNKSPYLAVVLMVTQEHLDSGSVDSPNYHRSIKEYVLAKKNIVRFQGKKDFAVINYDFERSRDFGDAADANVYYFSVKKELENGAFLSGNELILNSNGKREILCQKNDIFLRGEHNIQNILAAATASVIYGADLGKVADVIKTFKGLEHRLEFVREVNGVSYYNDSFSTTPETAIAAIKSFGEPEVLILGGSEKGSDYSELGRQVTVAPNIRAVLLVGKTAGKIKEAIAKNNPKPELLIVDGQNSMEELVKTAKGICRPGDVVILTPACASFDMFKSYKDRGQQFKNAVNKL